MSNLPDDELFSTVINYVTSLTELNEHTLALQALATLYQPAAPALCEVEKMTEHLQGHNKAEGHLAHDLVDLRWHLQRLLLSILKHIEPDQSRIARIKAAL